MDSKPTPYCCRQSDVHWDSLPAPLRLTNSIYSFIKLLNMHNDLRPFNLKNTSLLGYPKVTPYTMFEHFRITYF